MARGTENMPTGTPGSAPSVICAIVALTLTMAVRHYDRARDSHVHVFDNNYDGDDATAHGERLNSAANCPSRVVTRLLQTAKKG